MGSLGLCTESKDESWIHDFFRCTIYLRRWAPDICRYVFKIYNSLNDSDDFLVDLKFIFWRRKNPWFFCQMSTLNSLLSRVTTRSQLSSCRSDHLAENKSWLFCWDKLSKSKQSFVSFPADMKVWTVRVTNFRSSIGNLKLRKSWKWRESQCSDRWNLDFRSLLDQIQMILVSLACLDI